MKKYAALLVMPGLLALQGAFAQTDAHLKLSDGMPKPGEKLTFTYDATGTPVAGKTVQAAVYYLDGKDYPVEDLTLTTEGALSKGSLTIPAKAKAFFVKFYSDKVIDDNSEKGYLYPIYEGKKPVEGAYAAEAWAVGSGFGMSFAKIKIDLPAALALYKQEFDMYPKNETDVPVYVNTLIRSKDDANKGIAMQKVTMLAQSSNEKSMMAASNLFLTLKMPKSSDSLKAVIKTKYPNGDLIESEAGIAFAKEKDLAKKEELYNAYIQKYPEPNEKKTPQDNLRLQLAGAYLAAGDMINYQKYAGMLKDKTALVSYLNNAAWTWAEKGEHLEDAAKLSKLSLDLTTEKMNAGAIPYYSAASAKTMMQGTYDTFADTYAYVLYKQGKFGDALKVQELIMERAKNTDPELSGHYALYLAATGDTKKANEILEKAFHAGKTTDDMEVALKMAYVKDKGSDKGYDVYLASLKGASDQSHRAKLAKEMMNKPAPAFALKDFDGNLVSLESLKGKVVIVDFWATWCGPCKASFPGMQLAVTKFKDNPNVKFLFIDTWENGDDYQPSVQKFIADNKYTFHVLMDEKIETGRQAKVVTAFGVNGIPTKFIIDGNGNIRFTKIGFEGSSSDLADEVSMMIDMTTHPETVTTEKVAMDGKM